jgi:hypothetical protein
VERKREKENRELENINKQMKELKINDGKPQENHKVLEMIEKLENKLQLISKRILKRELQEKSLQVIKTLYGKWLKEERESCDKQIKTIQELLFHDMKTKKTIQIQLLQIKVLTLLPHHLHLRFFLFLSFSFLFLLFSPSLSLHH